MNEQELLAAISSIADGLSADMAKHCETMNALVPRQTICRGFSHNTEERHHDR
jgi:hypothetical protein